MNRFSPEDNLWKPTTMFLLIFLVNNVAHLLLICVLLSVRRVSGECLCKSVCFIEWLICGVSENNGVKLCVEADYYNSLSLADSEK